MITRENLRHGRDLLFNAEELGAAINDAWSDGYQAAVTTIREIAEEAADKETADALRLLADTIEGAGP